MKAEKIDLTHVLNKNCEKTKKIIMTFRPITAMSISNNVGSQGFFSLQDFDHKVRGMVENMLGVDLPVSLRNEIIKLIKENKSSKEAYNRYSGNGWFSIFTHIMDVNLLNPEVFDRASRFDDLHKRLMRRPFSGTHMNGCENKTKLIHELYKLIKENGIKYDKENKLILDKNGKVKTAELGVIRFVEQNVYNEAQRIAKEKGLVVNELIPSTSEYLTNRSFGKIPYFHKGVFNRENVVIKEDIIIELSVTQELYDFFMTKYNNSTLRNDVYLGDSNSLVSISKISFE